VDVSVVIPTRNRWAVLAKHALRSALAQEDVDFEVLVVDDGSTDECPPDVAAFRDSRVKIIRHDVRQGQARARNAGSNLARGEWIAFLDDDDLWSPRKLRNQLDAAGAGNATFVYTEAVMLDRTGRIRRTIAAPDPSNVRRLLLASNVIPTGSSTIMAKRTLVLQLGGFDERLSELSDWDMWIRLAEAGHGAACDDVLVAYLLHPGNRRRMNEEDVFAELDDFLRKHRQAWLTEDVRLRRHAFAAWVATGHLMSGRRLTAARIYAASAFADRSPMNLARAGAALLGPWASFETLRRALPFRACRDECPPWLELYRRDLAV
jgi:glycosyltransferase involved in cell wall biosynthesis